VFGFNYGDLTVEKLAGAFMGFGFSVPLPAFNTVFSGFEFLGVILVTAIPFGIYDLVEAMDNVESAEAAGDAYPTTRVLTADGVVSLIGCLMGNPFINAVGRSRQLAYECAREGLAAIFAFRPDTRSTIIYYL
jgi:adenine/guanine/hypoxanthine permease